MKTSVVMVNGGYRERFHSIDALSDQTLPDEQYELIWVEYFRNVNPELANKQRVDIVVLGNDPAKEYHSSYCFNEGIRRSKGEVIVIPDADVMVERTFLESVIAEREHCDRLALCFNRMNEPKTGHVDPAIYTMDHLRRVCLHTVPGNFGGCLTVRKKWLLEINGYEQDPIFGSAEHANGYDVNVRLKNLGVHVMWHPTEFLYHPWHPTPTGGGDRYPPQISITRQRERNLSYLANYGLDSSKDKDFKEVPDNATVARKNKSSLI